MAACTDAAVAYAKERVQFGRTIGTFQAVKHHCADMLVAAELATAAVWDAARAVGRHARRVRARRRHGGAPGVRPGRAQRADEHPGARRHRLHVGARRPPVPAAGPGAQRGAGLARTTPRTSTAQAARGTTRDVTLDLPPEAEAIRAEIRAEAARIGALPGAGAAQGAGRRRAARAALARALGSRRGRGGADRDRRGAAGGRGARCPGLGITGWNIMTVNQYATPDQVERWVFKTLMGEYVWCQLFSEPDAGSDAAAVKTRGTRGRGRLEGQRPEGLDQRRPVLPSRARPRCGPIPTPPSTPGITTMVIDMHAPGVEVRPLRQITGNADFNEVFFNDVFVPDDDVVGTPERRLDGGALDARQRARLDRRRRRRHLPADGPPGAAQARRRPGAGRGRPHRGHPGQGTRAQGAEPPPGAAGRGRRRTRARRAT